MKNLLILGILCVGLGVVSPLYRDKNADEIDAEIETLARALKENALKKNFINDEDERALDINPDALSDEELLRLAGIIDGDDDDDDDVDDMTRALDINPDALSDEELLRLAGIIDGDDDDDDDDGDDGDDMKRREMLYQALQKRLTPHPDQWPPIRWPWRWPWRWPPVRRWPVRNWPLKKLPVRLDGATGGETAGKK